MGASDPDTSFYTYSCKLAVLLHLIRCHDFTGPKTRVPPSCNAGESDWPERYIGGWYPISLLYEACKWGVEHRAIQCAAKFRFKGVVQFKKALNLRNMPADKPGNIENFVWLGDNGEIVDDLVAAGAIDPACVPNCPKGHCRVLNLDGWDIRAACAGDILGMESMTLPFYRQQLEDCLRKPAPQLTEVRKQLSGAFFAQRCASEPSLDA